jgi:hypothetical protein
MKSIARARKFVPIHGNRLHDSFQVIGEEFASGVLQALCSASLGEVTELLSARPKKNKRRASRKSIQVVECPQEVEVLFALPHTSDGNVL